MRPPAEWSFQDPFPFDVLVANGLPEIFTYTEPQSNQATVDFVCEWDNRYELVRYLLGGGVYGAAPTQYQTRTDLFAKRAVITGFSSLGFSGGWVQYEFAKVNVTFLPQPSGQPGNENTTAIITVDSEDTSEYLTVPGRQVYYDDPTHTSDYDATPLPDPAQIFVPMRTHKVSVHQWFSPPFSTMDAAKGKPNSLPVRWIGRTIPAECLLFKGYHETVDVYLFGIQTFKVEMTFGERSQSWNKTLTPDIEWIPTEPLLFGTPVSYAGIFP